MTDPAPGATLASTPSLLRRMACFTYEGVLLFGVLMVAAYLFSSLAQQRHALSGRSLLQLYVFLILGVYFVWFWTHGGQTLAMKTWRIRLVTKDGAPLSQARALARYILSWLWFVPALLVAWGSGTQHPGVVILILVAGVLVYASASLAEGERQFLHDSWCGTRLVSVPPAPSRA